MSFILTTQTHYEILSSDEQTKEPYTKICKREGSACCLVGLDVLFLKGNNIN